MEEDRRKWNARYEGSGWYHGLNPSPFLAENVAFIKERCSGRRALDIACGEGRNSIFLARHGFQVTALDISDIGIEKGRNWAAEEGLPIDFRTAELEGYHFTEPYDVIVNINFLLRDLIPKMVSALTPGGVVVFESILDSPYLPGQHNKQFLLQPGELHRLFSAFTGEILHLQELPAGVPPTARLLFLKNF